MIFNSSLHAPTMRLEGNYFPCEIIDTDELVQAHAASGNQEYHQTGNAEPIERFRILLVAKDAWERQLMCDALSSRLAFPVAYMGAAKGASALQILSRQKVNMIVFSQDVDDMSILGFMGRLCHKQGESRFPVVGVLNSSADDTGLKAMKMGAYAYLPKGMSGNYFELLPMLASRINTEQQMLVAMRLFGATQQMLVKSMPAAVYTVSLQGGANHIYISPQISEWGLSEELWGNDAELHHRMCLEEDRPLVKQALEHSFITGEDFQCEYRIKTAGGALRWFHDCAKVVMDKNGYPLFLRGVMTSINYIKSLESELARYRFMVDKMVCERTRRLNNRLDILESCNAALSDNYHKMQQKYLELWRKYQLCGDEVGGTA